MKQYNVFVSGIQGELKNERLAVKEIITQDVLLKQYFEVFLFEDLPAKSKSAERVYLNKISKSDILILLLGKEYGNTDTDGLSATEREFRKAKEKKLKILVYLEKENNPERSERVKNLIKEIRDPKSGYIYKAFNNIAELKKCVYNSLVDFLDEEGAFNKAPFDSISFKDATYKSINEKLVKDFLTLRAEKQKIAIPKISIKDFLIKTIGVVKETDRELRPTNTAILFFCDNPQQFIPQSSVKVARYRGNSRIEFIDSRELFGPFYKILGDIEIFFKRNTRLASKIVEFKRVDIPEYPFEAIKEAVINAMAHRNYFLEGANVQLEIFDDRIEITSPGGLLPGLDIKKLAGIHKTRNKKICDILHETKDVERYGTGIVKMKKAMKDHGLKPPFFSEPGNFFRVIFHGPSDKILDLVSSIPKKRETNLKALGLNERQIEALRMMVNERKIMTNREYRKLFSVTNKTAATDLNDLVKLDMVRYEGKGRSIRYFAK